LSSTGDYVDEAVGRPNPAPGQGVEPDRDLTADGRVVVEHSGHVQAPLASRQRHREPVADHESRLLGKAPGDERAVPAERGAAGRHVEPNGFPKRLRVQSCDVRIVAGDLPRLPPDLGDFRHPAEPCDVGRHSGRERQP
jgi:hypothetical protein